MKKLLASITLLLSMVPIYAMEAENGKGEVENGGAKPVITKKKKAAGVQLARKEEEGDERAVMRFPAVYFSPNNIQDVLVKLIDEEKKQLRGAWYRFTLYKPAQAIAERIKNRVAVSLVIDKSNFGGAFKNDEGDFCEGLALIARKGGEIYRKETDRNPQNKGNFEIMHHKFMIFDNNVVGKKLVGTGSFNGTGQADLKSDENWVIMDDPDVVAKFEVEHATLLALSKKLSLEECTSAKTKKKDRKTNFAREMNGIPH
jgi:phosphatidylserine/phosphatidylglycerophosphate/cardiolipin synthase-like enzyme